MDSKRNPSYTSVLVPPSMYFQIDVELIEKATRRAKTVTIDHVTPSTPVTEIKAIFVYEERLPLDQQVLEFKGKVLHNNHMIGDYKICNGSTLHLAMGNSCDHEPTIIMNQLQKEQMSIQEQMQQLKVEWKMFRNEQRQITQEHVQQFNVQWKDREDFYQSKYKNLKRL